MFGRKKNVDLDLEEKQQTRPESQGSSNGAGVNMVVSKTKYEHKEETAREAAERGVVATDQYVFLLHESSTELMTVQIWNTAGDNRQESGGQTASED